MPDVSRTEIGRRIFSLQKEKNVEQVIEKIRKHMGPEWAGFSQDDLKVLKYMIGETWVYLDREFWEKVSYARITKVVLLDVISIGRKSLANEINRRKAVEDITDILLPGSGKEG